MRRRLSPGGDAARPERRLGARRVAVGGSAWRLTSAVQEIGQIEAGAGACGARRVTRYASARHGSGGNVVGLPKGWTMVVGGAQFESGQAYVWQVQRDGAGPPLALKRLKNANRRERFAQEVE